MSEARRQGLIGRSLELVPKRIDRGIEQALAFLARRQNPDGSWFPLWFGNQDHPNEDNPVYGTAKVLMAYPYLGLMDSREAQRGIAWLVANQNDDGGWGSGVWGKIENAEGRIQNVDLVQSGVPSLGEPVLSTKYSVLSTQYPPHRTPAEPQMPPSPPIRNPQSEIRNLKSSVEETALAVEALLAVLPPNPEPRAPSQDSRAPSPEPLPPNAVAAAVARGLAWLLDRVEHDQHRQPAPIGFYFAKLWYYERLYPLIFTTAALGRACRVFASPPATDTLLEPSESRAP